MSFHTITMFVRWAVTADRDTARMLDEFRNIPPNERLYDERIVSLVKNLHDSWQYGTRIERLATLGWIPHESVTIFCNMLDNLNELRAQYRDEVAKRGVPPPLNDDDLEKYEAESNKVRTTFKR